MAQASSQNRRSLTLTVAALGVVYGDIGTSPLYALRQCFHDVHGVAPTEENVLGVLSLIIWSLILIVTLKYLTFVLRADNKGEGGILSLLALAFGDDEGDGRGLQRAAVLAMGVFGAALLYGDGIITPAISVLSAMEGLQVASVRFEPFILPLTVVVLIGLFAFQRHGTAKVGGVFGPVTLVWFGVLSALGIHGILLAPRILTAVNPFYGVQFILTNGAAAFVVLGAVFLVVTGSEALYADLGHFGGSPIRRAWFAVVFPSLLLNYLGQGGLVLSQPEAVSNPFYLLAPQWATYALVLLATAATVIASQALITGAFSITMQAIQLGYLPRLEIRHTSPHERGQIYMPFVNGVLMVSCIGLVLGFASSSRLAAAYGIAVTMTMLITTVLFYFAARRLWKWSRLQAGALCLSFLGIELVFLGANALKVFHGGWFPLLVAAVMFLVMSTWKRGRRILGERLSAKLLPFELFLESIQKGKIQRVPGTAVFMSGTADGTPLALLHNLKHNRVLHERNVLLTVVTVEVPHTRAPRRVQVEALPDGFWRVVARVGFMDTPDISEILERCAEQDLKVSLEETTFFLSRERLLSGSRSTYGRFRERLFAFLARNAQPATAFFGLPPNRVVELGMQVEL